MEWTPGTDGKLRRGCYKEREKEETGSWIRERGDERAVRDVVTKAMVRSNQGSGRNKRGPSMKRIQ